MVTMMCWFNTAAVPNLWTTYASATGKFVLGANANLETTGGGTGSHSHSTNLVSHDPSGGGSTSRSSDGTTSTNSYTAAYIYLRLCYLSSINLRAPKGMILMSSGDCPPGWIDVAGTVDKYINVGATDGSENADTGGATTGAHTHIWSGLKQGISSSYVGGTDNNNSGIGEWIKLRFCEKT